LSRPFWVAVTRLEFASAILGHGRDTEASELLGDARATFAELRAQPWLERADALVRDLESGRTSTMPA
jgi:hypothetical protein